MTKVIALLALVLFSACAAPEPPRYFSVDSEFNESERKTIHAVVDAWCDAAGWCPEEALWADRGRIMLVDDLPEDEDTARLCPKGATCKVAGNNDGDNVRIARDRPRAENMVAFWGTVAHEIGHFCAGHSKTGLMVAVRTELSEPVIDADTVRMWRDGCAL